MYIPQFVCGIVFTLLVEIGLLMALSAWSDHKREKKQKER